MTILNVRFLLDICLKNKKSLTPTRLMIFEILSKNTKPLSAYHILEKVNSNRIKKLNISTIYRVLEFWIELGQVHKISSLNKFFLCLKPNEKHVHMINYCTVCENIFESCNKEMGFDIPKKNFNFKLSYNRKTAIEIPVICSECN